MNEKPIGLPAYSWPNMSLLTRQYVVVDDRGRYGIAHADARTLEPTIGDGGRVLVGGAIWAHPINLKSQETGGSIPGSETLPAGAVLMTATSWHWEEGLGYIGHWADDTDYPSHIAKEDYGRYCRRLTIVSDLGWVMPDWVADQALAGSYETGYWNYGAKLGKVGGEPPVKGQTPNEMTVGEAEDYAREVGEKATARGIRLAARNGYIPGARKVGRDWLIPYEGFNHYLDHRPAPGPKVKLNN